MLLMNQTFLVILVYLSVMAMIRKYIHDNIYSTLHFEASTNHYVKLKRLIQTPGHLVVKSCIIL